MITKKRFTISKMMRKSSKTIKDYLYKCCIVTFTIGCLFTTFNIWANPIASKYPLWQKALKIAQKNQNWVPTRISEQETVYNEKGDIEELSVVNYKLRFAHNGLKVSIISARTNNIDSRKEKEAQMDDSIMGSFLTAGEGNPFSNAKDTKLLQLQIGAKITINNRQCQEFSFLQSSKTNRWKGKVWIERATGIPTRLQVKALRNENFSDGKVSNINFSINYNHSLKHWYPNNMQLNYKIRVKIFPMYYFNGRIYSKLQFKQYQQVK